MLLLRADIIREVMVFFLPLKLIFCVRSNFSHYNRPTAERRRRSAEALKGKERASGNAEDDGGQKRERDTHRTLIGRERERGKSPFPC